ncbi:MAG TPA: zf-HC2 domain-containing protein [Vicinamibacterales bacterium]|jgi:anti-sigma factor RsiW|nr:zf-HC2 domain-containing protein [Vicinamibacterales bacterium]
MTTQSLPPCRETLQNISAYLDGELDATACEAIEQHSLGCPSCAALLDGLRTTVGLCRQAAHVELPESVRQRARDAVRRLLDQTPSAAS